MAAVLRSVFGKAANPGSWRWATARAIGVSARSSIVEDGLNHHGLLFNLAGRHCSSLTTSSVFNKIPEDSIDLIGPLPVFKRNPEDFNHLLRPVHVFKKNPEDFNNLLAPLPIFKDFDDEELGPYLAEFALLSYNKRTSQDIRLSKVFSTYGIRLAWSIYSVAFEGIDTKGDLNLFYAVALEDHYQGVSTLSKCEVVEDEEAVAKIRSNLHSEEFCQGITDPCTVARDAIVHVNVWDREISEELERYAVYAVYYHNILYKKTEENGVFYVQFWSGSKLETDGGVLHFLVMLCADGSPKLQHYLAVYEEVPESKGWKLIMCRRVDELF